MKDDVALKADIVRPNSPTNQDDLDAILAHSMQQLFDLIPPGTQDEFISTRVIEAIDVVRQYPAVLRNHPGIMARIMEKVRNIT